MRSSHAVRATVLAVVWVASLLVPAVAPAAIAVHGHRGGPYFDGRPAFA